MACPHCCPGWHLLRRLQVNISENVENRVVVLVDTHIRVLTSVADVLYNWAEIELHFGNLHCVENMCFVCVATRFMCRAIMSQPASVAQGHAAQPAAPVLLAGAFGGVAAL